MRVHDSQAYRKMEVTREHISCILELREILLSIQIGFSLGWCQRLDDGVRLVLMVSDRLIRMVSA